MTHSARCGALIQGVARYPSQRVHCVAALLTLLCASFGQSDVRVIRLFPMADNEIWFMKGSLCPSKELLAVGNATNCRHSLPHPPASGLLIDVVKPSTTHHSPGNKSGRVYVWHIDDNLGPKARCTTLAIRGFSAPVRGTAFSPDGRCCSRCLHHVTKQGVQWCLTSGACCV